jgi:predicted transposase YbfD/YdcC
MGCNPNIAESILDAEADYLLAVKDNQPTLHADIKSYFDTAPCAEVERCETIGKEHGRLEIRTHSVSHSVDWIASERSYPGAPRFPKLATIAMVESKIERGDKIESERRSYISSRALSAAAFADAVRGHWAIENNMHWTLDMTFNEDQSRLRAGHGAKNMAVVRHFALNLVRQATDKRSIKRRRIRSPILAPNLNLDSVPCTTPLPPCADIRMCELPIPVSRETPRLLGFASGASGATLTLASYVLRRRDAT